jgi:DNA invertase Pin-like site-specific DNA recombinase
MVFTTLSVIAQAKCHRILERIKEGRIEAKLKVIKLGRKRTLVRKWLNDLYTQGVGVTDIERQLVLDDRETQEELCCETALRSVRGSSKQLSLLGK